MDNDQTMTLVIIRHGESEWNLKNLFTGWTDVDLTDTGRAEAHAGGKALKEAGYDFDLCYTSLLKRAIHTLNCVLDELDRKRKMICPACAARLRGGERYGKG